MKKLFTLFLVLAGCVSTASADGEMWLRSDLNGSSWSENKEAYQFSKQWDGSQDVYELTITSAMLNANTDFYFRLYRNGTNYETSPWGNGNYTYKFENGQNETYNATSGADYQGTYKAFCVAHSAIKANEYKITVYLKYNDPWEYYIKVEIVSMPATINPVLCFATFSCDRALDLSGVNAYYASGVTDGKVVLTKTTGKVPAGTGLLLAGSGDVTIPVVATADATALSDNLLKASVTETQVAASTNGAYHYFLAGTGASDLGFYNIATATPSGAGKAYLETTEELASEGEGTTGARAAWVFQDETQGINSVENAQNANVIYDLQGRVVKTAKAGLYIKNGKKVLVK